MKFSTFDTPEAFAQRVRPYLLRHEAINNLILGLTATLIDDAHHYRDVFLATIEADEQVKLAAMRTGGPFMLLLSHLEEPAALASLCEGLRGEVLPGVLGPSAVARAFATLWCEAHASRFELARAQRIYQLEVVRWPTPAPGKMRGAQPGEQEMLVEWILGFERDAELGESSRHEAERWVENYLRRKALFIWESVGEPVSMAGFNGPTPNGIRVSYVYSPAHHRRRGYASNLVAHLSQHLLDEGRSYCFLYTDLANPTSNHIYQAIGYEPVVDVDEYRFHPQRG
ncbi:MAG: GNAT family N-acetyltransferase [Bradymonadaceae bacterium]|nr:GNAT family N-acetyltransferase [Lujinxingiaceae bacterium]